MRRIARVAENPAQGSKIIESNEAFDIGQRRKFGDDLRVKRKQLGTRERE